MIIGLLTGGGDSPAINGAIRAIVRRAHAGGSEVYAFRQGWLGVIDDDGGLLSADDVSGILPRGGTILGTSRTNPFKIEGGVDRLKETLDKHNIQNLISIGGDDTNGVARRLCELSICRCIGIPQTIDNDIPGTEFSIGYDSALNIVVEALDRLHTTATSHHRVMVCEIMGRDAGWLALLGGLAGGADIILIPEREFSMDDVCEHIRVRGERGKSFSIVAIAEGAKPKMLDTQITQDESIDAFGHVRLGGIGQVLAKEIEKRTGYEARTTVLGHLQRGGVPSAFDRVLSTMFGVRAVELLEQGSTGLMVVWQASEIRAVPFHEALHRTRVCPDHFVKLAELFS
ncbi:6-phosphofructokinase [bacterium]|nr:6-phosphofructokinase [bacterium]